MHKNLNSYVCYERFSTAQTLSELFELHQDYIKMCSNYSEFYTTIYLDTIQNNFKRMLSCLESR